MSKKLSVLLGLRDKVEKTFSAMLKDMLSKFKNHQSKFQGVRKTYQTLESYADDDTKRGFVNVASTVDEQLAWLKKYSTDFLSVVFSIEKTNSTGVTAELVIAGQSWGTYSTLELLRLKGILDGELKSLVQNLPIRSESVVWAPSTQPEFGDRHIWETPINKGFSKTTLKRIVIVDDPMIDKGPNRAPVTQQIDTQVNVGEYTQQDYSGAITNLQRATLEAQYNILYTAVIEALETANNVASQESDLGDKVLQYLFK